MKLFTLDQRLIIRKAGRLAESDRKHACAAVAALLSSDNKAIMRR
jgi:hypothetical protein